MSQLTLRQQVYDRIKQDIITCALAPGQLVNESEMAKLLEVSKTPVREALTRLAQDTLVELIPRKGYLVTTPALSDIQEIFELRLILERAATELAAERITDAEIKKLGRYLEIDFAPDDRDNLHHYIQANKDFHMEIAEASRNSRLIQNLERSIDDVQRLHYMALGAGNGPWDWSDDHRQLIETLQKRDREAAAAVVEETIADLRLHLLIPQA